ncbi:hypothetical protein G7Y89_g4118 [Cudoniella acicularis]|uniref:Uncharacterized protein n=1 Tax=Cudoniella acicularis TaxID=354080 RepID=A0A8H4RS82_9HELO|nr:hypothetical protein G7Y89_g4118 [Cudoniella acicularis]
MLPPPLSFSGSSTPSGLTTPSQAPSSRNGSPSNGSPNPALSGSSVVPSATTNGGSLLGSPAPQLSQSTSSPPVTAIPQISSGSQNSDLGADTIVFCVLTNIKPNIFASFSHVNIELFERLISALAPTGNGGGGGGGGGSSGTSGIPLPTTSISASPEFLPITQVILGDYVPLIIGRGVTLLLSGFYHQLLDHEPIRLLDSPGGASMSALAGSSGSMLPVSAALILAQIGSGFSPGATFLDTSQCNTTVQSGLTENCQPRLTSNPWVLDVILIVLIIQTLVIIFVITQWWKKPSHISADPTSIAGVAAVMGHPKIEAEFSRIPTELTTKGLARRLKGRKFKLGAFITAQGLEKYGIMPADEDHVNNVERKEKFSTKVGDKWFAFQNLFSFLGSWKSRRVYFDITFIVLLLTLLGLTISAVINVDKPNNVFLASASATATGMRIFYALLGVIVSTYWGRLFRDTQTFAPYTNLSRSPSNPARTILLHRHSIPLTAFLPLLYRGHLTAGLVALTGLSAELLIIALSGLPYRPGQQRGEFLFWGFASLAIIGLMLVQLAFVMIWRSRLPALPRPPDNIANVMTYVAGTKMGRDFVGLEGVGTRERDERIRGLGKRYGYFWRMEEGNEGQVEQEGEGDEGRGLVREGGSVGRVRWVIDVVNGGRKGEHEEDGFSEHESMI